jgi:DNA polymerase-3 subunit delta
MSENPSANVPKPAASASHPPAKAPEPSASAPSPAGQSKPPLLPAYIIAGTDAPKVQRSVRALRQRIVEESGSDLNIAVFDVVELDRARRDVAEILAAIATPGLVLGHRAVIVLNADKLKAAVKADLLAELADLPPETTVALVGTSFPKTDKLLKAIGSLGRVLIYDLPARRDYPEWLGKRAKDLGLHLTPTEARHLARLVGEDAWRLDSELTKLAACVGARPGQATLAPVGRDDIDAVCSPSLEVQVWDLTDAVGRRDSAAAFRALEELIASGDQRRSYGDPLRGVLAALSRHIADLRRVHTLARATPEAVAKELDIHPFRARKLVEQAQGFSMKLADRALVALARADAAMVGASQLEPELSLERALAEILHA